MNLKYLFKVEYTDGTKFRQPSNDVSSIDPKRSAFYDVLNSDKEVKTFEVGSIKVDLLDGIFYVNGQKIIVDELLPPCKKKLIFYRQHQHDFLSGSSQELDHRVTYFLGYEATIKDQKHKRVIGIT
jgi:hypothetical protein